MQSIPLSLIVLAAVALAGCKDAKPTKPATNPTTSPSTVAPAMQAASPTVAANVERPKLIRAEPLPQIARAALRKRMQSHGDDTENLLWAALMLDFESTEGIAAMISKAPTLARPHQDDLDTINAMLPPQFFDLQEQLDTAISNLRTAAKAKDGEAVATQYGKTVETCIACHSLFLQFPTPE
jgi:cytochrome c556